MLFWLQYLDRPLAGKRNWLAAALPAWYPVHTTIEFCGLLLRTFTRLSNDKSCILEVKPTLSKKQGEDNNAGGGRAVRPQSKHGQRAAASGCIHSVLIVLHQGVNTPCRLCIAGGWTFFFLRLSLVSESCCVEICGDRKCKCLRSTRETQTHTKVLQQRRGKHSA